MSSTSTASMDQQELVITHINIRLATKASRPDELLMHHAVHMEIEDLRKVAAARC